MRTRLTRFAYRPAGMVRLLRAPSLERRVAGRVALVTGASSGIGRATAIRLGAAGATVALVARSAEALAEVADEILAAGGAAHVHACDLRDTDAVERLAVEILATHGGVDILVNNAGRSIRRPLDESYDRLHDFERCVRLNYLAPVQLTLALLPAMRARGRGHVINVSTMGTQTMAARFAAYLGSKAALDAFSRCLAVETHGDGIHVTTIHPPLVHTPMAAAVYDGRPGLTADEAAAMITEAIATTPARVATRLGAAAEIARLLAPVQVRAAQGRAYRRSLNP